MKVGDRVRFVALPEEWNATEFHVHKDSVVFMRAMIARTWPSRVFRVDDDAHPWIAARMRKRGQIEYHTWLIQEETGWRLVLKRD